MQYAKQIRCQLCVIRGRVSFVIPTHTPLMAELIQKGCVFGHTCPSGLLFFCFNNTPWNQMKPISTRKMVPNGG